MSAQFDLFGGPPTPIPVKRPAALARGEDRLLFALYPPPEAVEAIAARNQALRTRHGLTGRPRPPQVLHITLRHVADTVGPPEEVVAILNAAAAQLKAAPFEVTLDHAMRFAGSRAFVLLARSALNPGLIAFQQALCNGLDQAGAGWRVGGGAFTPHLTLSYEDREVDEPVEPLSWTVRDFVLTHSLIGQTRHATVGRFVL